MIGNLLLHKDVTLLLRDIDYMLQLTIQCSYLLLFSLTCKMIRFFVPLSIHASRCFSIRFTPNKLLVSLEMRRCSLSLAFIYLVCGFFLNVNPC